MVLRFISEIKVNCNNCHCELSYEDHRIHSSGTLPGQADIAVPNSSTAADPSLVTLGQPTIQLCQGEITTEMENIGMRSSSDGKTAMLKTGGKVTE